MGGDKYSDSELTRILAHVSTLPVLTESQNIKNFNTEIGTHIVDSSPR